VKGNLKRKVVESQCMCNYTWFGTKHCPRVGCV